MKRKSKLKNKYIPVSIPDISNQDIKIVNSVLKKGWISSDGPEVKLFEKEFSKKINRKYSIAVSKFPLRKKKSFSLFNDNVAIIISFL